MQRDMGCLQFYCSTVQDVFDTVLQAYRNIEDSEVRLPAIVGYDGWELSHSVQRCEIPDQAVVDEFLPDPRGKTEESESDWVTSLVFPDVHSGVAQESS